MTRIFGVKPTVGIQNTKIIPHLDKLYRFVAIAEAGSLSRAAKKLRVSQSALSQCVAVLEDALGVSLLIRTPSGVLLSESGRMLLDHSQQFFCDWERFENALKRRSNLPITTLKIGTKEPLAVHIWPRYLDYLSQKIPHLTIDLITNRSNSELLEQLSLRELDLLFIANPPSTEDIRAYEVSRGGYRIYQSMRSHNPTPKKPRLYVHLNAIATDSKNLGQLIGKRIYADYDVREVDSFETARAMAIAGLGYAVLTTFVGEVHVANRQLMHSPESERLPVMDDILSLCACIRSDHPHDRFLRSFIQHLKEA